MPTDSDLIAAFIANKGVTTIAPGLRAMDDRQMKRAIGYAPEKEYKYEVQMQGEDGKEFALTVSAPSVKVAHEDLARRYPEAAILSVEPFGTRDEVIYEGALYEEGDDY